MNSKTQTHIFITTLFAKHDFATGAVDHFAIEKASGGWVVYLGGNVRAGYLATARNTSEPRLFKSIDAAVIALEEIGFSVSRLS